MILPRPGPSSDPCQKPAHPLEVAVMPDAKGRKEGQAGRARARAKVEPPAAELNDVYHEEGPPPSAASAPAEETPPATEPEAYTYPEEPAEESRQKAPE